MANEKRATLRWVGEAETWFHHQSILGNGGNSNLPEASPTLETCACYKPPQYLVLKTSEAAGDTKGCCAHNHSPQGPAKKQLFESAQALCDGELPANLAAATRQAGPCRDTLWGQRPWQVPILSFSSVGAVLTSSGPLRDTSISQKGAFIHI